RVQPLRLVRQAILGFSRSPQLPENLLALPVRAVGKVDASYGGKQPVDGIANSSRLDQEGAMRLARLGVHHTIAGRHHQIGWPGYPLAQVVQYGRGGLGDAFVAGLSAGSASEIGTGAVMAVAKAPRHKAKSLEGMQDAQQAWLRYARCQMEVL